MHCVDRRTPLLDVLVLAGEDRGDRADPTTTGKYQIMVRCLGFARLLQMAYLWGCLLLAGKGSEHTQ